MSKWVNKIYLVLIALGGFIQPILLLGIRLFWGWEFFSTGRDKLNDISQVIDYFASLGIPFPYINAYVAATTECVGGFCLLIGFASRLVSLPLMVTMVVALLTAHSSSIATIFVNPLNLVSQLPFTFLLASLIVFTFGPGLISIDGILKQQMLNHK